MAAKSDKDCPPDHKPMPKAKMGRMADKPVVAKKKSVPKSKKK